MRARDHDDKFEGLCKLHVESQMLGHSQRRTLGGLNAVQEMILTWAKIGSGSSLPHVVRPRIIVVLSQTESYVRESMMNGRFLCTEVEKEIILVKLVLGRALFMFVDVICIFEDDLGGLNAVQEMILTWAKIGSG
jgi:hypothetical protein